MAVNAALLVEMIFIEYDAFLSIVTRLDAPMYEILLVIVCLAVDDVNLAGNSLAQLFVSTLPAVSDLTCSSIVVLLPLLGDDYFQIKYAISVVYQLR